MREIDPNGRYCMLLRKSREDVEAERHGHFETLEYHEAELCRLADNLGIKVAKIYRELVSGDRLDERPQTQELVREVMRGQWDGVLARDLQRITRGDLIDQGTIINAFKYSRTLIITPQRSFDLSDDYDERYVESNLRDGRTELGWIKDRMINGKVQRSRDGQFLGPIAPFGWRKTVEDRKRTLEPDENHDTLYQMYLEIYHWRHNPTSLAHWLNTHGLFTQHGNLWDPRAVVRVIRNEVNIGYVRWNQRKTLIVFDENLQRKKVRRVPDESDKNGVVIAPGLHMGRGKITEELFEGAIRQLDLHGASKEHGDKPLKNPLARLLVCANCGRAMRRMLAPGSQDAQGRGKTEWYIHSRINRHECNTMSAPLKTVVEMVADALESIVSEIEVSLSSQNALGQAASSAIDQCEACLRREEQAVENLFRLVEKGLISDGEFGTRKRLAEERIEAIRKDIKSQNELLKKPEKMRQTVINVKKAIGMLRDYEGRAKEVNEVLGIVVEKITYERDPQTKEIHLGVLLR